tara:strand:- start:1129 stop:2085 length:957 start_codon:yes stop_codon:yes gene_type:complete
VNLDNKIEYRKFVSKNRDSVPIYFHPEWLDAVCNENWECLCHKNKDGEIDAIMPLPYKNIFGFKLYMMPKQTQQLGVWIKENKNINTNKIKFYSKTDIIYNYFINNLPKHSVFKIRFLSSYSYLQPFQWRGFIENKKYTYILNDIKNTDAIFKNFKSNLRRNIAKAERLVRVNESDDIKLFYEINKKTFTRQKMNIKYSYLLVKSIDDFLKKNKKRIILFAKDKNNEIHSAIYIVLDNDKAIYLWGGSVPKFRSSESMSLLMWEAIKKSSLSVNNFDFEGSMIKNIAKYYQKFNPVSEYYFELVKINNPLLKILYQLK